MLWPKRYAATANSTGMRNALPMGALTFNNAASTAAEPQICRRRKSFTTAH